MKLVFISVVIFIWTALTFATELPFIAKPSSTRYGSNQSVGRFVYTGDVPRILNPSDLEVYVSKVMLTVRAKGWVSDEQKRVYASQLLIHWDAIRQAFEMDSMSFEPVPNVKTLAANERKNEKRAQWLLADRYYMKHNLEDQGVDIYDDEIDRHAGVKQLAKEAYKNKIILALLRYYTLNPSITLEQGLRLVPLAKNGEHEALNAALGSRFFERHLKDNYTESQERAGYSGFLTYVYPIAATTAGPFSIEREGLYALGQYSSDEARWHSPRWDDEFGGFPFLAYTSYGIAFHGPITKLSVPGLPGEEFANNNFWYLNRGYVSHGCHRMEASDVMEFRQLLPDDITTSRGVRVKVVSKIWPDSDLFNGVRFAFNVDYYTPVVSMLAGESVEDAVARNAPSMARETYLRNRIDKLKAPSQDPKNLRISRMGKDIVLFDGLQTYTAEGTRDAVVNGIRVISYPARGNRIMQYRETGVVYSGGTEDKFGKFPPTYFSQRQYLDPVKAAKALGAPKTR